MVGIARWARDRPDAPFLIAADGVVDYRTAWDRVSRVAGGIRSRYGVGSRLGLVMHPTVDTLLVAGAVPLAGMVLVALPARATRAQRGELVSLAKVEAVIGADELAGAPHPTGAVDADRLHSIVFTSGSSGTPRGVRLTWGNIEASAAASASHLDHRPDDRWLAVLPLHHVGGLSTLWRSMREGSAVVLGPARFDPVQTIELLTAWGVTLASFVSTMVEAMIDRGLAAVPGFRFALLGGGPVSSRVMELAPLRVLPTYGMTETASQIATADPSDPRPDRLVVLDGADVTLSEGGRIVVAGPMVSPGDFDAPDRHGPLVTGDLGKLHGDRLEVLGRADTVIVTGGESVMPERLERIIAAVPGVGAVAVVGVADMRWGSIVGAVYTGLVEPAALDRAVRRMVAPHEVPRRWLRVAEIPMMGIGKVDRNAVADLFG